MWISLRSINANGSLVVRVANSERPARGVAWLRAEVILHWACSHHYYSFAELAAKTLSADASSSLAVSGSAALKFQSNLRAPICFGCLLLRIGRLKTHEARTGCPLLAHARQAKQGRATHKVVVGQIWGQQSGQIRPTLVQTAVNNRPLSGRQISASLADRRLPSARVGRALA